jgi:hypothetical protein
MGDFNAEMGNNQNRSISGWDSVGHQGKNGGNGARVMGCEMLPVVFSVETGCLGPTLGIYHNMN